MEAKIHNFYLTTIKGLLGASFVGWEQVKNEKQLKIIIGKKQFYLPFDSGKDITEDSYKDVIHTLTYGTGETAESV